MFNNVLLRYVAKAPGIYVLFRKIIKNKIEINIGRIIYIFYSLSHTLLSILYIKESAEFETKKKFSHTFIDFNSKNFNSPNNKTFHRCAFNTTIHM
jgi:hypothetical protein